MTRNRHWLLKPTNEGQEMNYVESFKGSRNEATVRARDIVEDLRPILVQGRVGCLICDSSGKEVGLLS